MGGLAVKTHLHIKNDIEDNKNLWKAIKCRKEKQAERVQIADRRGKRDAGWGERRVTGCAPGESPGCVLRFRADNKATNYFHSWERSHGTSVQLCALWQLLHNRLQFRLRLRLRLQLLLRFGLNPWPGSMRRTARKRVAPWLHNGQTTYALSLRDRVLPGLSSADHGHGRAKS